MFVRLEGIAGDRIQDTAAQMLRVANVLGISVISQFNEVELMAQPRGNEDRLVANYKTAVDSDSKYAKFASSL